jgi:hypothetical protein
MIPLCILRCTRWPLTYMKERLVYILACAAVLGGYVAALGNHVRAAYKTRLDFT